MHPLARAACAGLMAGSVYACAGSRSEPKSAESTPVVQVDEPGGEDGDDGQALLVDAPPPREPACCAGRNECRGLGGCAVEGAHDCAGKNDCKGKGGSGHQCEQRVGECCAGRNECKGKGGCKTAFNDCAGRNECKGKGGCRAHCPR